MVGVAVTESWIFQALPACRPMALEQTYYQPKEALLLLVSLPKSPQHNHQIPPSPSSDLCPLLF